MPKSCFFKGPCVRERRAGDEEEKEETLCGASQVPNSYEEREGLRVVAADSTINAQIALTPSTDKDRHSGGRASWLCLERCSSLRAREGFQGNERVGRDLKAEKGYGRKLRPFLFPEHVCFRAHDPVRARSHRKLGISLTSAGRIFILRDRARLPEF